VSRGALAAPRGLDASQIVVPPPVAKKLRGMVCVHRQDVDWGEDRGGVPAELRRGNLGNHHAAEGARGSLRWSKAAVSSEVFPIDGKPLGWKRINRESGKDLPANHVFASYQEALNAGLEAGDPQRLFIVNETGLSETARPNQTYPDSYLAEECAFWSGPGADQLARDWFRDNFGITFQEEKRPLKVIELRLLP
jgi:hypothetical protein